MIEDKINKHTSPIPGRRLITEEGQNVSSPGGMGDNHPTTPHNNPPFAPSLHFFIITSNPYPPSHHPTQQPTVRPKAYIFLLLFILDLHRPPHPLLHQQLHQPHHPQLHQPLHQLLRQPLNRPGHLLIHRLLCPPHHPDFNSSSSH